MITDSVQIPLHPPYDARLHHQLSRCSRNHDDDLFDTDLLFVAVMSAQHSPRGAWVDGSEQAGVGSQSWTGVSGCVIPGRTHVSVSATHGSCDEQGPNGTHDEQEGVLDSRSEGTVSGDGETEDDADDDESMVRPCLCFARASKMCASGRTSS